MIYKPKHDIVANNGERTKDQIIKLGETVLCKNLPASWTLLLRINHMKFLKNGVMWLFCNSFTVRLG